MAALSNGSLQFEDVKLPRLTTGLDNILSREYFAVSSKRGNLFDLLNHNLEVTSYEVCEHLHGLGLHGVTPLLRKTFDPSGYLVVVERLEFCNYAVLFYRTIRMRIDIGFSGAHQKDYGRGIGLLRIGRKSLVILQFVEVPYKDDSPLSHHRIARAQSQDGLDIGFGPVNDIQVEIFFVGFERIIQQQLLKRVNEIALLPVKQIQGFKIPMAKSR